MVTKPNKKVKTTNQIKKKITKRTSTSTLLKKVAQFQIPTKHYKKKSKVMSKIFGENQKVLVSMKGMIDTSYINIRTNSKTIKTN